MSRHLERLLTIDRLIRSRERQTTGTLAEVLEVSERTIRSDLAFLRDRFDAPLVFKRPQGWHYTESDWRLPSVPLTQGELFALTLGARMLSAYAGSAYGLELQSAMEQLAKRLPAEMQVDLQALAEERVLFNPRAVVSIDQEIWQKLMFACQTNRQVKMRYFTAQRNKETERQVDPYVVYFSGMNPCMSGFCHSRQAMRDFRIDRMRELEILTTEFERNPEFDPKAYLEQPFFHERGGKATTVRIWFDKPTAAYIKGRQWHPSQSLEEHDDGVTLGFMAYGLSEVKRWVMYYGRGARVLEPPELVAMMRKEVQGMGQLYELDKEER
ncbi:MAG: WYL domain-containing transcriptional regulator [Cyanobacteria bacterium P01_G01_bin.38]